MKLKTHKLLSILLALVLLLSLAGPLAPSARAEGPYKVGIDDIFNGSVTADKETANEGETVRLTVTPSEGYIIESVSVYAIELHSAVPVTDSEGNYVFTMPASEVQASATFRPAAPSTTEIPSVAVTVTEPAVGAAMGEASAESGANYTVTKTEWLEPVEGGGTKATSDTVFVAGKTYLVAATLTPNSGYVFSSETTGTVNGKNATDLYFEDPAFIVYLEFTLSAPATTYTITVNGGKAYKAGGVEITSAAEGDSVYILFDDDAAPAGKYIEWGSAVTEPAVSISAGMISGTEYQAGFIMPAANITVSPDYLDQKSLTVDLTGGTSTDTSAASNAVWSLYRAEDLGLITADISDSHQEKFDLDKDGSWDVTYSTNDSKFSVQDSCSVTGDKTLTIPAAEYSPITFKFPAAPATTYTVTLIAYDKNNGTEQAGGEVAFSDSGKGTRISGDYEGNSSRTVGVYPASDYSFAGWAKDSPSGEIVSTSSPYTFTVTEDVTLYALFEKITTYPVWVGGEQVTSANKDDILGDGKAKFDPDSNTLTLNGLTLNGAYSDAAILVKGIDLTIVGSANVTNTSGAGISSPDPSSGGGITLNGDFTITGTTAIGSYPGVTVSGGTLKATATDTTSRAFSTYSPITISDGLEIIKPEGGKISSDQRTIEDAAGNPATYVEIGPKSVTYPVWVGGEQVTDANKDDILGDGTASFDPATNTLTLTDATISTYGSGNAGIRAEGIDLIIEGSGSVSGAFGSNGIAVSAKDGSGGNLTLNANLAVSGSSAAIQAENTLTIKGGEVTTSNSSSSSTAVKAGAVDIQGGKVNAECSGDRAFKVTGDFTMSGGEVTAKYGNYGIDVGGDVTVSDGTLTADGAMFGIITTGGDVTISGGTVTSSATSSTTNSTGISAKGNITISGGSVTATGGKNGIRSEKDDGQILISGGTVKATGTSGDGISGICPIDITGGTVEATGGSAGIWTNRSITIGNSITKVTADGATNAIRGFVIVLGDALIIQEPAGGTIGYMGGGNLVLNGENAATHAVIVPGTVTPLPKVVGIKVNVTGTQENSGAYDVTTDTLETSFESITAPVTMSTSFLYTDQACQAEDKLTTAPVPGTPYYFVISINAYMDGDPATLEWADNATIKSGSTLTADNGTVEIVEFFHSPAGGSLSVICKYTETVTPPTPGNWTVTFEANGGTPVPAAQTVADGGKATKPADPTKSGVSFGGWYKDSELTEPFDFNTPITADITLYASWNQYIYMLQIKKVWEDDDDAAGKRPDSVDVKVLGNGTEIGTVTLTKDEGWKKLYVMATGEADLVLTCEEIVPEGYTLKDMTKDGDTIILTNQFGVTPPAPKTHTVTFELNGGSAVPAQTVNDGEKATKPADPTKSGFVFDGWYQDATFATAFDFDAAITADVTVYAKWKEEAAPGEIVYTIVSGGNSTWTKGSSSGVTIVVKRNPNDTECFSHFTSVQIDGAALVNGTDFSAVAGSTVITLNASALQKLTTGTKTVTINFDDGKATTSLIIKAGSSGTSGGTSPKTGDNSNPGLWITVMVLSGLGLGGLVVTDKKRRYVSRH